MIRYGGFCKIALLKSYKMLHTGNARIYFCNIHRIFTNIRSYDDAILGRYALLFQFIQFIKVILLIIVFDVHEGIVLPEELRRLAPNKNTQKWVLTRTRVETNFTVTKKICK